VPGYLNNHSISRSDRIIRLIISKDHPDSSGRSKCSSRLNSPSLELSRLDGCGEPVVFGEKFDREAIEKPGLLELTGMAAFERSIQIAITSA
jgi:hypothetical protein